VARKSKSLEETLVDKVARLEAENAKLKIKEELGSDDEMIRLDSYVEVMSLFNGRLSLSTEPLGKGRRFSFSRFGETKRILYNDLASVMENYRRFMEEGVFYILNEKIVRKHGLNDIYEKILDKSKIEKIIACDPKTAVKFYEQAPESQREVVNGLLIKELKEGNPDLNVVNKISAIAERDLVKIAKESKELEAEPVS
jgi:hypothetical protein